MEMKVNRITARPFLIPAPGTNDDPMFTVIAHFLDVSLSQFQKKTNDLSRPGFLQRVLHPKKDMGVAVTVTRPDRSTFNVVCRYKSGQFHNTFDLIFPPGTKEDDVPKGSLINVLRFEWA